MKMINYLKGDATNPEISGNKIIAHICNDVGGWGKGFVVAVSKGGKNPSYLTESGINREKTLILRDTTCTDNLRYMDCQYDWIT